MPIHDWTRVFPGLFHHFHHDWISTISAALNRGLLPPDYYALLEQVAGGLGPDMLALKRKHSPPPEVTRGDEAAWYANKKKAVVVRHRSEQEVVALVEIVSSGNKSSRSALKDFVDKAVGFLRAGIHLLVIDLYPPTRRDPEGIHNVIWDELGEHGVLLPPEKPLTLAAYSAGVVPQGFIEYVAVGDLLPEMPLFIETETYVRVPLEQTYQSAFESVPDIWREELNGTGSK